MWKFLNAQDTFEDHYDQWDAINRTQGNHILLDSRIVSLYLKHFSKTPLLLGFSDDNTFPGAIILEPQRFGLWKTFQPAQAPLGLFILSNPVNIPFQIENLLHSLPGLPLGFSATYQDSDFSILTQLENSMSRERIHFMDTARISLTGSFDEYWKSRKKDMKENVDRRLRRLNEQSISIQLLENQEKSKMAACLQEYSRLESTGWKGKAGTAVSSSNIQGHFYQALLEIFSETQETIIFELIFNHQVVASQLALQRDENLFFLKMAYDENFKKFSPGFLLRKMILERLYHEEKIKKVEFYGRARKGWTDKWTEEFRSMFHMNFYRNTLVGFGAKKLKEILMFSKKKGT